MLHWISHEYFMEDSMKYAGEEYMEYSIIFHDIEYSMGWHGECSGKDDMEYCNECSMEYFMVCSK